MAEAEFVDRGSDSVQSHPYCSVTLRGAILLGRNVVADGPADRLVRIITHIHSDHLLGLGYSIKRSVFIVATPISLKMLEVLGKRVPRHKALPLAYNNSVEIDGETITLHPARHIAGSAQVSVESGDYRVGYTGDFKTPGTPPMQDLDTLVIDATYGNPLNQRRWSEWEALAALVDLVERHLREGTVWIYGFNGKLQEIMVELRARGVRELFAADNTTLKLARIAAEFYGIDVEPVIPINSELEGEPLVVFTSISRYSDYKRRSGTHIKLTGMEMRDIVVKVDDNTYNVSFSDHANFRDIISYIREARPRQVIVDAYRGKDAWLTAKFIEKKLGIKAWAEP